MIPVETPGETDKGCHSTNKKSSTQNKHQVWMYSSFRAGNWNGKAYWIYLRWEKLLAQKKPSQAVLMLGNKIKHMYAEKSGGH